MHLATRPLLAPLTGWAANAARHVIRGGIGLVAAMAFAASMPMTVRAAQQTMDEQTIIEHIKAERYEALDILKKNSEAGDPMAMYWWGLLLDACVLDACRRDEARMWWKRSAKAGYSRARMQLYSEAKTQAELAQILHETGEPEGTVQTLRFATAALIIGFAQDDEEERTLALVAKIHQVEPTQMSTLIVATFAIGRQRPLPIPLWRAMVAAGSPAGSLSSEGLIRALLISERKSYGALLSEVRKDDLTMATALCEAMGSVQGLMVLPPKLLPLCKQALSQGQLGLIPVLLTHHLYSGQMGQADLYAEMCRALPVRCGEALDLYYQVQPGKEDDREIWAAVNGLAEGTPPSEVEARQEIMRRGLSRRLALAEITSACMFRRFDPVAVAIETVGPCPWGRPFNWP